MILSSSSVRSFSPPLYLWDVTSDGRHTCEGRVRIRDHLKFVMVLIVEMLLSISYGLRTIV